MLVQLVKLIKSGERVAAHDLFDRHLPLLRYEQQPGMPGLAVRKYILKRRGAIASDAQRKPGVKLSKESIAEIEFLIARLERNH
jgi:4-hydroxy-tetrahydrodipicolinate synthase